MARFTVLLADDHRMFADGVRRILSADYDFIGTVEDGHQLLEAVQEGSPDVILIDISMPKLNGIDAVRKLKELSCTSKLIILTMHADPGFASAAFDAGVDGYLLKHCASEELNRAVSDVLRGKPYLTPMLSEDLMQSHVGRAPELRKLAAKLTPRERQVLQLIAEGNSIKEIAAALDISPRTVEFHRYNAADKLGAKTIAELARYAVRHGLVGP